MFGVLSKAFGVDAQDMTKELDFWKPLAEVIGNEKKCCEAYNEIDNLLNTLPQEDRLVNEDKDLERLYVMIAQFCWEGNIGIDQRRTLAEAMPLIMAVEEVVRNAYYLGVLSTR